MQARENPTEVADAVATERDRVQPAWRGYYDAVLGFRNYWYPALFEDELGDTPVPLTLLGEKKELTDDVKAKLSGALNEFKGIFGA